MGGKGGGTEGGEDSAATELVSREGSVDRVCSVSRLKYDKDWEKGGGRGTKLDDKLNWASQTSHKTA